MPRSSHPPPSTSKHQFFLCSTAFPTIQNLPQMEQWGSCWWVFLPTVLPPSSPSPGPVKGLPLLGLQPVPYIEQGSTEGLAMKESYNFRGNNLHQWGWYFWLRNGAFYVIKSSLSEKGSNTPEKRSNKLGSWILGDVGREAMENSSKESWNIKLLHIGKFKEWNQG